MGAGQRAALTSRMSRVWSMNSCISSADRALAKVPKRWRLQDRPDGWIGAVIRPHPVDRRIDQLETRGARRSRLKTQVGSGDREPRKAVRRYGSKIASCSEKLDIPSRWRSAPRQRWLRWSPPTSAKYAARRRWRAKRRRLRSCDGRTAQVRFVGGIRRAFPAFALTEHEGAPRLPKREPLIFCDSRSGDP